MGTFKLGSVGFESFHPLDLHLAGALRYLKS